MRLLLLATVVILARAQPFWKCCDFGEVFNPSSYQCVKDLTKRLEVVTNFTNFMAKGMDGTCSEATQDGIITLQLLWGKIIPKALTKGKFFPKCCPLGYFYNSQLHSCTTKEDFQHDFVQGRVVKVGLPHCKLIVDNPDPVDPNADYCLDEDSQGNMIRRECRKDKNICKEQRCVKKCCPDGKSFVDGSHCLDTYSNGVNMSFSTVIHDPTGKWSYW